MMIPGMPKVPPVLTHLDLQRLEALVASNADATELQRLEQELRRATIIPAHSAPSDLVTMNSTVLYDDEDSAPKKVTLVYPWDIGERDAVSVLSPLGTSLLGMRVGRSCVAPEESSSDGGALRVVGIAYQPEAAGDWHL